MLSSYLISVTHLFKCLRVEKAIANGNAVAANEISGGHGPLTGGLKFEDFEGDVGGGDEEASFCFED